MIVIVKWRRSKDNLQQFNDVDKASVEGKFLVLYKEKSNASLFINGELIEYATHEPEVPIGDPAQVEMPLGSGQTDVE